MRLKLRQVEIGLDRGIAQIDRRTRRRVTIFAVMIERAHIDQVVRQADVQHAHDMLVEHPLVEGDPVADERPCPDETQQFGQHISHTPAVLEILAAQLVHLDRGLAQRRLRLDDRPIGLARQDAVALDGDGCDADDVINPGVEPRRFAIERNSFIRVLSREKIGIAPVIERDAVGETLEGAQHQENIDRW